MLSARAAPPSAASPATEPWGGSASLPLPSQPAPLLVPTPALLARPAHGLRDRRRRGAASVADAGTSRCNKLASDRARAPMPRRGPARRVRRGAAAGGSSGSVGLSSRPSPQPPHERGAVGCSGADARAGREASCAAGGVVAPWARPQLTGTLPLPPGRCAAAIMSRRTALRVVDGCCSGSSSGDGAAGARLDGVGSACDGGDRRWDLPSASAAPRGAPPAHCPPVRNMSSKCSLSGMSPGMDIGSSEQDPTFDGACRLRDGGCNVPFDNGGLADGGRCRRASVSTTTTVGGNPTSAISIAPGGGGRGGIGLLEPASLDVLLRRRFVTVTTLAARNPTAAAAFTGVFPLMVATGGGGTEGVDAHRQREWGRPDGGTLLRTDHDRGCRVRAEDGGAASFSCSAPVSPPSRPAAGRAHRLP